MLATIERVELLEHAERLGKMVLESNVAEHYRDCLYKLRTSRETQSKISRFVKLKDQYEDVQRFGKYHPDYKSIMMQIREAKRDMDMDKHVAEFKLAENDLQSLLDEISVMIGSSVSKHIKVPTGNPFFDTGSNCGTGGCGTGGSCGCSA
ncbi:YlbF family regulator [Neobacillus notoginsengisoli]|uniref:YlbF family regulator n=1 Tax=Neobacillus notoginsengisoli TaxID=1578198 RepID=A0A417YR47_9BACI|nr:YlbF family regulator [Neobacillus notoginsengisoli]RHW36525.1 YlbF family regulator [Neobacillus notoginsengisoli]